MDTTRPNEFRDAKGHKWHECAACGPALLFVRLFFTGASVEPTLGETVTGATSGCTGIVDRVHLYSGTYAGGDAVGDVLLLSPTGYDIGDAVCFTAGEALNGSIGGAAFMTCDAETDGLLLRSGSLYPEGRTIMKDGKRYCEFHYHYKWDKRLRQEAQFSIDEGDRENPTT